MIPFSAGDYSPSIINNLIKLNKRSLLFGSPFQFEQFYVGETTPLQVFAVLNFECIKSLCNFKSQTMVLARVLIFVEPRLCYIPEFPFLKRNYLKHGMQKFGQLGGCGFEFPVKVLAVWNSTVVLKGLEPLAVGPVHLIPKLDEIVAKPMVWFFVFAKTISHKFD